MPTTIGRNRRQYMINIKAEYTDADQITSRDGGSTRTPVDHQIAWDALYSNPAARLLEADDRSYYTIVIDSSLSYELYKPSGDPEE